VENLLTKASIIQKPIIFTQKRETLTRSYIKEHYGFEPEEITIIPKMVVVHWTAIMDLNESFAHLNPEELLGKRVDIAQASALNVSAHFLVDRDGTIYQLMPENIMARHVIGLNYSSIGIENVGGENNEKEDLTPAQLEANIRLITYLQAKYPTISHVIGHHEYMQYEKSSLWLEKDTSYRTQKKDPGEQFMQALRSAL
jgi:beta-N-acetylhexosaminidase